ncbi:hypothetical protein FGE05_23085 [Pseudomonas sp. ICMP22404]|uniref:DUF6678 family protein n=1 Tax=Pseudomonas sp. ICMP22404 TaxID=2583807 RepID=UPI00111BADF2|nr:DUF6678 family protein [Pseudomonas sp. ICMP22404]TNF80010.1 hypothetical protein FGE05_23085 [Pseudomonas sp. ICMP22404]
MSELPTAGAGHDDATRRKVKAAVTARNLTSASNNTKWNELISHFRQREGWRPSYRYKPVTGYVSDWDTEWFYHLPFPFAGVEWFDIGVFESGPCVGHLLAGAVVDHSDEIAEVVGQIGFEFEVCGGVLRIWGYLPKTYEDFPTA